MPVTIVDVARHAGVSKSTVSLVMNDSPLIREATKEKVRRSIEELGYVPNFAARNLSTAKTSMIGIVIACENRSPVMTPYFRKGTYVFSHDISEGISTGLASERYGIVTEYHYCSPNVATLPEMVAERKVDGVILIGTRYNDTVMRRVFESGMPAVAVGHYYDYMDSVYVNMERGAYIPTERVILGGTKVLLYLNCPPHYHSHAQREAGFFAACRAHPDPDRQELTYSCEMNSGQGGYDAIAALWEQGVRPDAVVAANETIALGAMRFFDEKGLRIPDDVSIAGYESSLLGEYSSPPLTSVAIGKHYMGESAVQMLLARIENPEMPPQSIRIEPRLVERATVRPISEES